MGILDSIFNLRRGPQCALPVKHPIFVKFSTILRHDVTRMREFEEHLIPAVNEAVAYFERQVNIIPPALPVSQGDHGRVPAITNLFPDREDIVTAVGRSIDARQTLPNFAGTGQSQFFALLGMRHRPDDPTEKLTDHTLRGLAITQIDARNDVRDAALMRLATSFGEHIEKLERQGKLLRSEWQMLRGESVAEGGRDAEKFVYAAKELNPENMLRGLVSWLRDPGEHLRISPPSEHTGPGGFSVANLPVLHSADRRQWFVCFVRMDTTECVGMMNQERRIHRYIFI